MVDVIYAMAQIGILKYIIGMVVAFGAIALYFTFIKKA